MAYRASCPLWWAPPKRLSCTWLSRIPRLHAPTTHDLLLDALTNLDASVDHVLIDKVKGSLFFAKLTLSQHGRLIELDARPSDALSLALREDAPLYINEDVLERASYPYIVRKPIEDESSELELEKFRSFLEDLDPKDFS